MEMVEEEIFCESVNKKFKVIKFTFKIDEDKKLIDSFKVEGKNLADKLNPTLARDSTKIRKYKTKLSNATAGMISEYIWRFWLNNCAKKVGSKTIFNKVMMENSKNQIDIEVIYPDNSKKTIEVRSSFPYSGIQNAICRVFDIIGWYSNKIKIKEIKKDYYVRVLFPSHAKDFLSKIENGFEAYLTGGATKSLLETSRHARFKNFIPDDEISEENDEPTDYRVIEPIVNAKDTIEIQEIILFGKDKNDL